MKVAEKLFQEAYTAIPLPFTFTFTYIQESPIFHKKGSFLQYLKKWCQIKSFKPRRVNFFLLILFMFISEKVIRNATDSQVNMR